MDATDLAFAGAAQQALMVRQKVVSAREVVEATLSRIEQLNPQFNAYRVVYADQALAQADQIDSNPTSSLPLIGVPVAIKDDADVAGEVTAWGTNAYGPPKRTDSDVVARLREAGAIIIGKTNVPEMTLWPWTASTTWGITRNPWGESRSTGGSSGGSAAAVAAGLCGVALGSDGGGSIRYPSAACGLFGIKPQRDRVSLGPDHHDAWNGLSVYGPLARSVRDAAAFLDATSSHPPDGGFVGAIGEGPKRLRVAVSYKPPRGSSARLSDDRRAAVELTAQRLRELGHDVFEAEVDFGSKVMINVSVRYLKGLQNDVATMTRPENLERNTRRLRAVGRAIPNRFLVSARRSEVSIAKRINAIFDTADVVLTPSMPSAPPMLADLVGKGTVRTMYRSSVEVAWLASWNAIGQPAASMPVGFDENGMPLAVQLCGPPHDEVTLLQLAAQFEHAHRWADRRPPGV